LQTTIVRGIKTLRNDSRFIDQLFRNLSQSDQEQIRSFITNNSIDLTINYPRDTLKVPAIVILLRSENEAPERQGVYLGDSMGYGLKIDKEHAERVNSRLDGFEVVLQE